MSMRVKRVLVLGCGPAGLFAAHAARQLGFGVDILSKKRRSEMFGAQYLHSNIPGLTDDQHAFEVEYRLNGSLEDYLHKVYGAEIPDPGKIKVSSLIGTYPAWDIRRAYLRAWDLYNKDISTNDYIHTQLLRNIIGIGNDGHEKLWSAVISTIPMTDLCYNPKHEFLSRTIWAFGDAPERGLFAPNYVHEDNVIQYDGTPDCIWYRASNIAGYNAVEWPSTVRVPDYNGSSVVKPVRTTCDCWDALEVNHGIRFLRMGRYGAWHRSGHSHQAYWRTVEGLKYF